MKHSWFFLSVVLSLLLPLQEVEARKSRSGGGLLRALGGSGGKDYGPNTLTVEQLKACILLDEKIDTSKDQLDKEQIPIEQQHSKLKKIDDEFSSLKSYIEENGDNNFDSQEQVDGFNQKVDRYNVLISEYKTAFGIYENMEKNFNSILANHNTIIGSYKADCAGKNYYEEDYSVAVKSSKNKE